VNIKYFYAKHGTIVPMNELGTLLSSIKNGMNTLKEIYMLQQELIKSTNTSISHEKFESS
jgi:hypothetical protein